MSKNPSTGKQASALVAKKREIAKRNIAIKVLPLFFEKGFEETTIKDMESATGMMAGSIYNLFDDKYDILRECMVLMNENLIRRSESRENNKMDILNTVSTYIATMLSSVCFEKRRGKLITDGLESWAVTNEISNINTQWLMDQMENTMISAETMKHNVIAITGISAMYALDIYNGHRKTYSKELRTILFVFCKLFNISDENLDNVVENTITRIYELRKDVSLYKAYFNLTSEDEGELTPSE